ncbi:hypothetical protein GOV04_01495 [Candidatus Woesearchaeota archaeon]|nr:hypothetical protein [Candidatus Woesearchaeota archaeon]
MKEEIKEFVSSSIKQIQDALSEGFILDTKLDFDISVSTKLDVDGKIDIKLAGIGSNLQQSNTHRLKFSIIDEIAQEKLSKQSLQMINGFFTNMVKLSQEYEQIDNK